MKLNDIELKTQDEHRIRIGDTLYSNHNKDGFVVTTEWYFKYTGEGDAVLSGIFKNKNNIGL